VLGVENYKNKVEERTGFPFQEARPFVFTKRGDYYGWQKNERGLWYYTVFVENGRITDDEHVALKSAMLEVAKTGKVNFRFTTNQNVIISDISETDKESINEILERFRIIQHTDGATVVRKNSIACVALPTCPLALAEAQRYMPSLLTKIESLLSKYQLDNEEIIIRMTGCPNGCARSYIAEIGFVGTAVGKYNLHLGGDRLGYRLNKIYKESLEEPEILTELDYLFASFKKEKNPDETFGDFAMRKQLV
jgi:sulfite reductase (NADPH) hemoprotein beta-component